MKNDPRVIFPESKVRVYDSRTDSWRLATVLRRYGYKYVDRSDICYGDYGEQYGEEHVWLYPDMLDVLFDDGRESRGHFTTGVEVLKTLL